MEVEFSGEKKKITNIKRVSKLLEHFGLNPEEYLVLKNGILCTSLDQVSDTDRIVIVPVVSGG